MHQYRGDRAVLGTQPLVHADEVGLDVGVVQPEQGSGGSAVCRASRWRCEVSSGVVLGVVGGHVGSEVWANERR